MIKSATSKLLLFAAAIAISGCQLDEILWLEGKCDKLESIVENGEVICTRASKSQCFQKHNSGGQIRQNTFESAFKYNLCPEGFVCRPEKHICELNTVVACNEGETKCMSNNIYTCTADGKWDEEPTFECAETGCSEGTIQPKSNPLTCYECGDNEAKCEGNKLIECSNRQKIATECEYGCVTAETNAYCRECKDDEKKCEKGFIVSCTKEGEKKGRWDDDHKQSCENGCFPGARGSGSEVSCYECETDKPRCFRDDETKVTTIKRCLAHNWYDEEDCALGCVEGSEAKCKLCNHGDKKYYNNEDGYCVQKECKDNQYQDVKTAEVSCKDDLSGLGECLNGSVKCKDNGNGEGTFQFCMNGSWNNFGNCDPNDECSILDKGCAEYNKVGQICENQKLVACSNSASCKSDFSGCASCQSGTGKCNGNKILKCINGEYQEIECKAGTHCEAKDSQIQCVQHDCENGQQRCQGNIIQKCENYKWTNISACENGEQCKENNGVAACSCISGTAYCDDTTAKNCKDGQWKTTACGQNISCATIGGEAKCIECESGAKCKDEINIMTCQNNAWSASTPCSDGMTCTGSAGNAKCACSEGQAVCDSDKTKIKKCKADGTYGSAESCGTDKHCEGVAGSAVCTNNALDCSPGTKQCDGDKLKTCNSKGKWESQTCEKGCSNMACNECNEGEYGTGDGDDHEFAINCVNHKWIKTDCYPNFVEERQDLKKAICKGYCTVGGSVWCEGAGQARYRCTTKIPFPNDPAYEPEGAPFYALDGTCECDDPMFGTRCSSNNGQDVLQICNVDGEWEDKQNCYICEDNICYPECTPGTYECNDNNSKLCDSKGNWGEPTECKFGCNKASGKCYPECKPGTKQCDDSILKTCNNLGEWDTGTPCPNGCNNLANDCK